MKRYVRSSTAESPLTNVVRRIDYFVLVDDCNECDFAVINAPDNIDDDSTEYLLTVPDKMLKSLSDAEIESINNVGVLDRLAKVCRDRLTPDQIEILTAEYKKEIPLDRETKLDLLHLFNKCNRVILERRRKNLDFVTQYDLTPRDILSILHNLKEEDFDATTYSINYGHLGSNPIVLKPKILIPQEKVITGANLYVKLNVDESDHSAAAFISIHPEN